MTARNVFSGCWTGMLIACVIMPCYGAITLLNGPDIQSGFSAETTNSGSSWSWTTASIPAGTKVAILGVTNRNHRKASATLGGMAMTEAVDFEGEDERAQLFYCINPPTGAQTVALAFSGDTEPETSGLYCFSGVDLDTPVIAAQGGYGDDPEVSFTAQQAEAGAVLVTLVSTKDEMDEAGIKGGGTKTLGYRRWPKVSGWFGDRNGGAMGVVTGLNGTALTTGWNLPDKGTMGAIVLKVDSAPPTDIAPNALTVQDSDANGTLLGTLQATDADGVEPYTWTLVDSAGGRFALNASTATTVEVAIADATLIDRGSAGSHTIRVRVTDAATYNGYHEEDIAIQVLDTTRPVVGVLTVSSQYVQGGDVVTLTVEASDNVALTSAPTMTINGVSIGAPTSTAGNVYTYTYTTPTNAPQGAALIEVLAIDTAGNSQGKSSNALLTIDDTPPTITNFQADPAYVQPGTASTLRVTVSDVYGLADTPTMRANGVDLGAPTATSGNVYTYAYTVPTATSDGPISLVVNAVDRAGNTRQETSTNTLFVDGTAPVIQQVSCLNSPARAGDRVTLKVEATDANGLPSAPLMQVNGANVGAPSSASGDEYTYMYTLPSNAPEGAATVQVQVTDAAGNSSETTETTILFIDNTAPAFHDLAITPYLAGAYDTVTFSIRVEDVSALSAAPMLTVAGVVVGAPSMVVGNAYTYDYAVPASAPQGFATVVFSAVDVAGNAGELRSETAFTIDLSPPDITGLTATPAMAKAGDTVEIHFTLQDSYSPLVGIPTVTVDGIDLGAPTSHSGSEYTFTYSIVTDSPNGAAAIQINAVDMVNNIAAPVFNDVLTVDTQAPEISSLQANPNVAKDGDLVRLTFSAIDAATAVQPYPTVLINGNAADFETQTDDAYTYRYTVDGEINPDGPATVLISVVDSVGNADTLTNTTALLIDSTIPTISAVNVYPEFAKANDVVTIAFTVNDDNGLPGLPEVTVNGHAASYAAHEGSSYEYTYTVTPSIDVDGPASLSITATDVLGQIGSSESAGLLAIDMTPPAGTIVIDENAPFTRVTDVQLKLTADEGASGSGVIEMRLSDDGENWGAWQAFSEMLSWELSPGQGYKDIFVSLRDRAGNLSEESITDRIALNPNALTISVDGGNQQKVVEGDLFSLEVTVTGAFGQVTYDWTKLEGKGEIEDTGMLQGPVLSLGTAEMDDAGVYMCMVADELESCETGEIEVEVEYMVPTMNGFALALLALCCALGGAFILRHKSTYAKYMRIVLFVAILGMGMSAYGEYAVIYSAHTNNPQISDEALTALAKTNGSVEVAYYGDDGLTERRVVRVGAQGVGNPGFSSQHRELLAAQQATGAKSAIQRDGREKVAVQAGNYEIVYRLPKSAGAQPFEVVVYSNGQRMISERRTEEKLKDGRIRPLSIRLDEPGGSIMQIFVYQYEKPNFPIEELAGEAKTWTKPADESPLSPLKATDEKADDPITRMVQFTVPPQGMENLGFDSGWIPGGSGDEPGGFVIQVRLNAGAGFNYDANVSGNFTLANENQLSAGAASGNWGFYFGAEFFLKLAFDIPISWIDPFIVDIPYVPDFHMVASDRDEFNTYLLDETSELRDEAGRTQVVNLDLISLLITRGLITLPDWVPLPKAGVALDIAAVANGYLRCDSIDLSDGNQYTTEHETRDIVIPPAGYRTELTYQNDSELNLGAKVYPVVFFGILGWRWEWPGENADNFLTRLEWTPIKLRDFPFTKSELNFTGQPSPGEPTDWFTQHFTMGNNNVSYKRVLFTPNLSNNYYVACVDDTSNYRTSPYDGTPVTLGDNDAVEITLSDGKQLALYGEKYSSFFIGSNGYITFTAPDTENDPSVDAHFDLPRISGIFTDLKPDQGGTVYWKQYTNRVVVTFDKVFLSNIITENQVNFQIEMFFDGRIVITWLELDLYGGLIGLSEGLGTHENYQKSVFVNYPACMGEIPDEGAVRVDFAPDGVLAQTPRWRLDDGEWQESGSFVATPVGEHTITYNLVQGWAAPEEKTVTIKKDYLLELTETWTRQTGTVEIYASPMDAPWSFIDGDGESHTGEGSAIVENVPTGEIALTWQPLATYMLPTPSTQNLVLFPGASVAFTGNYPPIIGEGRADLTVNLTPARVCDAGAQWRFNGGAWQNTGATLEVPDGEAALSFTPMTGWIAPETASMTIVRNTPYDLTYEYVRELGTVIINVDPEGAPWALIDGDGAPHTGLGDTTLTDIPTGELKVIWGYVNTYLMPEPNPATATLGEGETLTLVGSYIPILGEGEGILSVTLLPEAVRNAGAQWRVTGGEWRDSGAMLASTDGERMVKFKPIPGWIAPEETSVMVLRNITNNYPFTYTRETGTVEIKVTAAAAEWTLTDSDGGIYEGMGTVTLNQIPSGPLSLTWKPLEGYGAPTPATVSRLLEVGDTIQFIGKYTKSSMEADFEAFPPTGRAPLSVQFYDRTLTTVKPVAEWYWYFGDGGTSTEQNPVHVYKHDGAYTVSLTVTNYEEIKMVTQKHLVVVGTGVPASSVWSLIALVAVLAVLGVMTRRGLRR